MRIQPILAELTRDPSLSNLARLVRLGLDEQRRGGGEPGQWPQMLDQLRAATVRSFGEYPVSLSWEQIMLEGSAFDEARRQVLIVEPVLEFGELLSAGGPIDEIRAAARRLGLIPERGVAVRITGNPALNYEEMLGLAWDVGYSSLFSFAIVVGLLFMAFRSWPLVLAASLNLLVGLVWTAAFAAAAVGQLNLVSIAFGVLFIGLAIDFAIHLGMQMVEAARRGEPTAAALAWATRETAASLVLCAGTTALGFYAFVPTEYRGVAELGLIAGTGMAVILVQTFVLFPALVALLVGDHLGARLRPPLRSRLVPPAAALRHPGAVVAVAAVLAALSLAAVRRVGFDCNVVNMRNPETESVQAFRDLLERSSTSPWSVDVLAPSLAAARALAVELRQLPEVESAVTAADYEPTDQAEKREILADAALLLDAPPVATRPVPMAPAEQIAALAELRGVLERAGAAEAGDSPLGRSVRRLDDELGRFLARVSAEPDPRPALASLERLLLGRLPAQLARLRTALAPSRVTLADLPPDLARRMLAPDGHARVQVFPRENVGETVALTRFVDSVRAIAPQATGVAVNLLEFGRATMRSFGEALLLATAAIGLLVWAIWRRMAETLLVLAPLALSGVLTVGVMALLGLPFNFANVVVLPLLLGMGVDSGIHLVSLSRSAGADEAALLDSTTARAVFYSAATTMVSFGNLALSHHRGLASMGLLLLFGMAIMLASNLVLLPALIALRARLGRGGHARPVGQA